MTGHRLATVLAIDVVGYSAMMRRDADRLVAALDRLFRTTVRPRVRAHGGRVVKLTGDGAIVEFRSAREALLCAAAIQSDVRAEPTAHGHAEPIALRMGLHAGDVAVRSGDIFGDGVNIASRLEAAAEPGGILASKLVAELAGGGLPLNLREEGLRSFRNIDRPLEVLSVLAGDEGHAAEAESAPGDGEIRFARTGDGVSLAWTSAGAGPPIVRAPAWISRIDMDRRLPYLGHFIEHFARSRRFVRFDARGNGLSQRDIPAMSFDTMVEDLRTVLDAARIDRAPILGMSQGCAVAAAFAVRHPERVSGIVMIGGFARGRSHRPAPKARERASALQAMMRAGWDDDNPSLRDMLAQTIVPLASLEERRRFAEDMREMITPEMMGRYREVLDDIDVTALLPRVRAPCLVLHCTGDRMHPVDEGRLLAAGLPEARFVPLDSPNHFPTANDPVWPRTRREIDRFLEEIDAAQAGGR